MALLAAALPGCAAPPTPGTGLVDSLGLRFVAIAAGEFLMGSDEDPGQLARVYPHAEMRRLRGLADEAPVHRVRITRTFWMGKTEVTVGQFRRFVQRSGYVPESVRDGTGGYGYNPAYDAARSPRHDAFEGRDPRYSWQNPGFAQTDAHPVVNVSYNDALAMARWLSKQEGVAYRLPTEAEWEYAARAGTRTRYPAGDELDALLASANTFARETAQLWPQWRDEAAPGEDGFVFTAPVASLAPNAWGLYDMIGNAWEWCADWYGEDYYARSPLDDPQGPGEGQVRVRRGGSWHTWPLYARVAFRNWNTPQTRYVLVGFRLVREGGASAALQPDQAQAAASAAAQTGGAGSAQAMRSRPRRLAR
ncbi:formylglycine-generating enzyme family protein [Comamonas flocculans]|nr:formylglycine-generating enzyme family protein [Comamonas flocculans]